MNKKDIKISITLTKKDVEFLDELSNEIKFSGGRKLGKAHFIRSMIKCLKKEQDNSKRKKILK